MPFLPSPEDLDLPRPFEKLPQLPNIKGNNPVRQLIEDVRTAIRDSRHEVSSIADALKVGPSEVKEEPVEQDEVKGGVAGTICSDEHMVQTASDIAEATRMARTRGIKDVEVRKRLKAARNELNQMERYDLVPEKIVQYLPEQQKIARWLLPRSAATRHTINYILTKDRGIEDLEKLSAYASESASQLTDLIGSLPTEQMDSPECLEIKQLPTFLEEIKIRKEKI